VTYREDLDPDGVHADQLYDSARDKAHEQGYSSVAEMLAAEEAADEAEYGEDREAGSR
jgi:hypothetical protein